MFWGKKSMHTHNTKLEEISRDMEPTDLTQELGEQTVPGPGLLPSLSCVSLVHVDPRFLFIA